MVLLSGDVNGETNDLEPVIMSLMAMKRNAKWFILPFLVLIVVGLMMMDFSGMATGTASMDHVGSVDGEKIQLQRFQIELQNYQQSEEARTGKGLSAAQIAQMRHDLFDFKVQTMLLQKTVNQYALHASIPEMQSYLRNNPNEVAQHLARYQQIESFPPFLSDTTFDLGRYRNWLAQDSVYDRISMRELEMQLKSTVIPQLQLQHIMNAQIHPTLLEQAHTVATGENKGRFRFYRVPVDSFAVTEADITEDEMRAHFEAHPDSFHFSEPAARLGFVKFDIRPSAQDTSLMLELARDLKLRVVDEGESFEEIAQSYSSDPSSAENGGRLEGYQPRSAWVPEFAEAAFNLEPGQISDPVLTQYGYHLILLHDKKVEEGVETASVSHVLLDIVPGTETVESLMGAADEIRLKALSEGSLAKAVEGTPHQYDQTGIFSESETVPLGNDYLQGARSFAFSAFEANDKVSETLQNDEAVFILEKLEKLPEGRDFERAKSRITAQLIESKKLDLARRELEKQLPAIRAAGESLPANIGMAILDSTALISAQSWVPGFGYDHPTLHKAMKVDAGNWSPVMTTDQAAVVVLPLEKSSLSKEEILAKAKESFQVNPENTSYLISSLYERWLDGMKKEAKIKNNLDDLYRS